MQRETEQCLVSVCECVWGERGIAVVYAGGRKRELIGGKHVIEHFVVSIWSIAGPEWLT